MGGLWTEQKERQKVIATNVLWAMDVRADLGQKKKNIDSSTSAKARKCVGVTFERDDHFPTRRMCVDLGDDTSRKCIARSPRIAKMFDV